VRRTAAGGGAESARIKRTSALIVAIVVSGAVSGVVAGPLAGSALAQSTADSAKQADIQKLMNLTGAGNLGMQAMDQMIASMKGAMANVPEKFWVEFRKEINSDELVNQIIPIYDKHLTHAELKELIKFYETPVGKKMIAVMTAITAESMQAGQHWGVEVARRAKAKLDVQKK
jgi:hypothetical protein